MTIIDWKPILKPIQTSLTVFGMSMNSILVLLILFRSPERLGIYKFLMVYISVFELFFGILELLAAPDLWTRDSAFIVITDPSTSMLPKFLLQISNLVYCGSFGLSLAVFAIQFVYRYQVFLGKHSWTTCRPRNVLFWMGTPLIFSVCWATVCALYVVRNKYTDDLMMNDILPNYYNNVSIDDIGLVSVYIFPKLENGAVTKNWDSIKGMIILTTMLISTETIMIFSGVKCYLSIKKLIDSSTNSHLLRRFQWQLFYALVSQTSIPIVFMQFPVSAVYCSIYLNSGTEFYGIFLSVTIPFYLATDALPSMFIVKAYRSSIFEYLSCVRRGIFSARPKTKVKTSGVQSIAKQVVTSC